MRPASISSVVFRLYPFFNKLYISKGTGLGLSISYKIFTEKHQGKLQCVSSLGEGTEFIITILLYQSHK
ncbi:ATP-binding protein [Halotia branconii]|uniref:ATP-binding protein n=1 Tax=Halotia branconii TaxID=1620816 RepID=UPI003CCF212A